MKILSSKEVYDCGLFRVTEDAAKDRDGFEIKRSIVRHVGSAVVLVTQNNSALLVRQYRLPAEKKLWEIPAGRLDPGETPLKAARRELTGRPATGRRPGGSWRPGGPVPDSSPRR